ncbi:MAG: deoxyribonuclease IV [Actinomycetota bacterium]|nr:deoxyribonuclease IV [Actinomycetota bacterium]
MLIGAHVSTAGGLPNALTRGIERECDAIQIFPQSSRMWRPTAHSDPDLAIFKEGVGKSRIGSVLIHAIYLVNCASLEQDVRKKSLVALKAALALGDRIGADGVVLHPGSQKGRDYEECMLAVGAAIRESLAESEGCPLLLEDTAGAGGTLGRDFDELARLIELGGGDDRLGICLDCCHLLASGFEVRNRHDLAEVVDQLDVKVGLSRLRALHINDSKTPLGSNRDRHANLGEGELGDSGLRVFLSEPRFEGLPAVLETPGADHAATAVAEIRKAKRLRREGLANRRRQSSEN